MRQIALACVVLIIGSGCTGPVEDSESGSSLLAPGHIASLGGAGGGIEGTVLEDSLLPIANATVRLENPDRKAVVVATVVTGLDGVFGFYEVAPGTYRVTASAPGFGDAGTIAAIRMGEITTLRLILANTPDQSPFLELFIRRGYIPCGVSWIITSGGGSCPVTGGQPAITFRFDVPAGHRVIVTETTWRDPTIAMDVTYSILASADDRGRFIGGTIGHPPIRHELYPGAEPFGRAARSPDAPRNIPNSSEPFILETYGFYDGHYQQQINATGYPVCRYFLGYCTGVGVGFDFRFTLFVSIFVHAPPDDIGHYTAIPDS